MMLILRWLNVETARHAKARPVFCPGLHSPYSITYSMCVTQMAGLTGARTRGFVWGGNWVAGLENTRNCQAKATQAPFLSR